ncbi:MULTISPECIES: SurA N-terminal domain-containing protein [unclassified Pseudomonas]|jgi:peptidyl-prolyl cis-trans isomerase D|uniref:SurA N-terminal domain-containing protein n=1 Tax=unclassified Pseudomonas TaxID=196821 RepID=UPI00129DFE5D|nr:MULTISPECIES: SurA N-terminal domain-containing protein [unclassified Pseudomonas]MDH4654174.1 peptidylprolyl isomerase [Pseudomonas sp. BN606]MRK19298.1 peptidylprolyl isomerase [Pseudomonas sp. JG-B]
MLQNIRDNSQGWIAKTIIGVIIALLALTGFDAIFNATSNRQNAAEVNGDEITLDQLSEAVNMQRRQLQQQLGKDFDASLLDEKLLREAALKGLIERKLLLQAAGDADFAFSQGALDQLILQTPEFQVDGKFNADRFDQVIRQMNYNRLQFRQMLEQEMLIGQLRAGLAGSGFVTDAEVEAFARLEKQTRDFATLTLKADPAAVSVSDEELKTYYDAHVDQFKSAEQVVIEYVELKKAAFFDQVEAKEEDLKAQYQKEISNLAEQRQAAHILVEVNDKLNEEQAKAKIEQVKQRLDKGEDFAALAKEFSDDSGSAANGGDLGFAAPGVYEPAFEESLYALKQGEVSAPVRTQYGWHLIKLLGVQAPEVPSFESLKPKLEHDIKAQQVEQRFVEVSKELEDAAFEASDLAQPAQELKLEVKTSAPFGREGGEGLTANRQVLQAAFSPEVLEDGANSSAIELDPDTVIVLRVKEHKKPEQLGLDKVGDSIRQHLMGQKAGEAAKAKGDALIASLREGKTPVEQAQEGQSWNVVEAATRSQEGVEPLLLQTLFRMPKPAAADRPEFTGVKLNNGDYVVIRLNGVNVPEEKLSEQEKAMYSRFLASRSGQQDFAAYRRQVEEKAKIERF